jgi:hypothetical protein
MVFAVVSTEERAERRAAAVRAAEEARRPRILDAVTRVRGVDSSALSLQVEEARTRKMAEKFREAEIEREILSTAEANLRREAALQEEKRAAKKLYGEELKAMMRRSAPAVEEAENAPFFEGEDPGRNQRLKLQKAQQADWIAQAIFEKAEAKAHATAEGGCYVPRDSFDENKRRRELARQFQEENQRISREKNFLKSELKRKNDDLGAKEVGYLANASLLNEARTLPATRENYKGATADAVKATLDLPGRLALARQDRKCYMGFSYLHKGDLHRKS